VPCDGWILPVLRDVAQCQPDQLGSGLIAGEMSLVADRLAYRGVEAFDRVGGVDDFPHVGGKGEEGDHRLPVAPPALGNDRVFSAPWPLIERIQFVCSGLRVVGPVDRLERGADGLAFLPWLEVPSSPGQSRLEHRRKS
jgi:hypothetical protein